MTQVSRGNRPGVALPIRIHELLLGLAGRLDDDALADARQMLASAELDRSLEFVAGCLAAGGVVLTGPQHRELEELFANTYLDPSVIDRVPVRDNAPAYRHRFAVGAVDGREPDRGVAEAIRPVLDVLPDVRSVWCVWRLTPSGPVSGPVPHRLVLVGVGPGGFAPATAYRVEYALRRAGMRASVEVLVDGAQPTDYHQEAMRCARQVPFDDPGPGGGGGRPTMSPVEPVRAEPFTATPTRAEAPGAYATAEPAKSQDAPAEATADTAAPPLAVDPRATSAAGDPVAGSPADPSADPLGTSTPTSTSADPASADPASSAVVSSATGSSATASADSAAAEPDGSLGDAPDSGAREAAEPAAQLGDAPVPGTRVADAPAARMFGDVPDSGTSVADAPAAESGDVPDSGARVADAPAARFGDAPDSGVRVADAPAAPVGDGPDSRARVADLPAARSFGDPPDADAPAARSEDAPDPGVQVVADAPDGGSFGDSTVVDLPAVSPVVDVPAAHIAPFAEPAAAQVAPAAEPPAAPVRPFAVAPAPVEAEAPAAKPPSPFAVEPPKIDSVRAVPPTPPPPAERPSPTRRVKPVESIKSVFEQEREPEDETPTQPPSALSVDNPTNSRPSPRRRTDRSRHEPPSRPRLAPVAPPATNDKHSAAFVDDILNTQERNLLRELQDELARREKQDSPGPWRSGRHGKPGTPFDQPAQAGPVAVNGVPPRPERGYGSA